MEDHWKRALGKQVRRLRRGEDLSQYRLGKRAGLHMNYISDVELGKRNPSLVSICQLAQGLGVKVRDLMLEIDKEMPRDRNRIEEIGAELPEQEVIADLRAALELGEKLYRQRSVGAAKLAPEEEELHRSLREILGQALKRANEVFGE